MHSYLVRIAAVAGVEFKGIVRSHPYLIFVPAAAIVVTGAPVLILFAFEERAALVAQVGLSTALFFGLLVGLAAGAGSLARDRAGGLRDLILTRPLDAATWVTGKWLGISGAVLLAVALLGGVHLASVAIRGGPPLGYAPLVAALATAAMHGALAAAAALFTSALLKPGPAFVAALLLLMAGHAAALAGEGPAVEALRFLLPRVASLNLAGKAAFGPLRASFWLLGLLHGFLYSAFLITLAARSAGRRP